MALKDVLRLVEEVSGKPSRVREERAQKGDMRDTFADTTAACRDLAFRSTIRLREGLARQWAWIQSLP